MRLDRNTKDRGKYGIINARKLEEWYKVERDGGQYSYVASDIASAVAKLEKAGVLEWGPAESENEFFVIKLKDHNASEALEAYANEAGKRDPEYADDVRQLADRAGPKSKWCKQPD